MIRVVLALVLMAGVAACGVDGEPVPPEPTQPAPPPQVTGGVTISNNGIYPSIGVSQGWWSVNIGRGSWW